MDFSVFRRTVLKAKNSYLPASGLFLAMFVLFPILSNAQNEANVWIGPTKVGLNFNGGSPTALETGTARGVISAGAAEGEGCSSISDSGGNLLFYTEGINVYNKNHAVMTNGSGLLGNISSTQSAIIVPCPADPTRFYYIFCAPPEEGSASPGGSSTSSDGITYSIVDMNASSGLGAVTTKNVRVTPAGENATEGLTAVPNFTGDGFWLIAHRAGDKTSATPAYNKFYIYGVTTADINATTGVINSWNNQSANVGTGIAGVPASTSGNGQVIIKANSCFNKLAMTFFAKNQLIEIYNFNNNTGAISLANSITNVINNQVYGVEFSPSGQFLYVTILETNKRVYQFDISSGANATINASRYEWTPSGTASLRWGQLQLGPDGKIYMAHHVDWNTIGAGSAHASIGVINNPDVAGAGANFVEQQITTTTLTGTGSKHGLPQIYKGFIAGVANVQPGGALAGLDQVCVGEPADFEALYTQSGTNWKWNIDANVGPNTTNEYFTQNITHTYSTAGTYEVVLTLQDATCGYEVTKTAEIVVSPVVNAAGTVTCSPVTGHVTSPDPSYDYVWYSDATATTPIATGTNVTLPISGTGNVYLKAVTSATSTGPTSLSNGYNTYPPDGVTAVTSMPFKVLKSVLNFQSFKWTGAPPTWNASTIMTNYTVIVRDVPNTTEYYHATVAVTTGCPGCSVSNEFTENVNAALPPGDYEIVITGGSKRQVASWQATYGPTTDASGALTYRSSGSNNAIASDFRYTLTTISATDLPCSKIATIAFNCPLPVTWLSFTAMHTSAGNLLNWATSLEENNHFFLVERSYDGITFEAVKQLSGAGNSNYNQYYSHLDTDAQAGVVYYRIKQVDIDGQYSYSGIRAVYSENTPILSVHPNPNNGEFTLSCSGMDKDMDIVIYNNLGQKVYEKKVEATQESIELGVDLSYLSKGMYHLHTGSTIQKIVIE